LTPSIPSRERIKGPLKEYVKEHDGKTLDLKGEKLAQDAAKHPALYEAVDYALREWKGIQNYLLAPNC
jgi:hypothetical protein